MSRCSLFCFPNNISIPHPPSIQYLILKSVSYTHLDVYKRQVSRLIFMQKMHKAYPITGAIATGAGSVLKGSIIWKLLNRTADKMEILRIGHPSGILPVEVEAKYNGNELLFTKLNVFRTARKILDGYVYVRK